MAKTLKITKPTTFFLFFFYYYYKNVILNEEKKLKKKLKLLFCFKFRPLLGNRSP